MGIGAILLVTACSTQGAVSTTSPNIAVATTSEPSTTIQTTATTTSTTPVPSVGVVRLTILNSFDFGRHLTASVGQEVAVHNSDFVTHTWTADDDSFDSGPLTRGETYSHTFTEPGEYTFFCEFHTSMRGSITIVD